MNNVIVMNKLPEFWHVDLARMKGLFGFCLDERTILKQAAYIKLESKQHSVPLEIE